MKARELYDEAMEDVFHILVYLEGYTTTLEKKLARMQTSKRSAPKVARKARRAVTAKRGSARVGTKKTLTVKGTHRRKS